MKNVISLLPWDLTVRRAQARRRANEILDRKDADQAIRALSPLEAYYAIKEIGLEAALPTLAVLEPEQITALFDLDIWHDDQVDLDDLIVWTTAFREAGTTTLARAMSALDPELLALFLRRRLLIALAPSDETPPHEIPEWVLSPTSEIEPLITTPDRRFIIAARTVDELGGPEGPAENGGEANPIDEDDRKAVLELVDILYKEDPVRISAALRLAESDLSSALEDAALHFRNARLEDLGFPPLARALEIYTPLSPEAALPKKEQETELKTSSELFLPAVHAERLSQGPFRQVLETIESPEIVRRIEAELVPLANAALVADRVEPGDLERMKDTLERMRAYLEIALEHGVEPERLLELGRERLFSLPLRSLFRIGFGVTLELQARARRMRASRAFASRADPLALLAETDRAIVDALLLPRPLYAAVLDDPSRPPDERRPFRSIADVQRAQSALDDLEEIARAARALGLAEKNEALAGAIDPPLPGERPIDMLLVTAASNVLLGRGFALIPLDQADLERLRSLPSDRTDLAIDAAFARAELHPRGGAVERRIQGGLRALSEALASLVGTGEIDPRFIGIVVRRLG